MTVVGRRARRRQGIEIVTVGTLDERDVTHRHRIPCSTPARAIVELAAVLAAGRLSWVLDTAVAERRVTREAVLEALRRAPTRAAGSGVLRALLADERGPAHTRSKIELAVLQLCRRAGLPAPEVNARLGPYEVDFLWPEHMVVLEVDSYAFHSTRERLRRDRRKDAYLRNHGFTVLRVADEQVSDGVEALLVDLARAIV